MPHTINRLVHFATAEDGADLKWDEYVPAGAGPFPTLIIINAAGFNQYINAPGMQHWAADGAERGYLVFLPHLRLVGSANWIPGQTVDGTYPTQINDAKRAVVAALADARCNGSIISGGGSGGGAIALYIALDTATQSTPIAWDATKRPLGCVAMSAATDFSDRTPDDNLNYFTATVTAFSNGNPDLTYQHSISPVSYLHGSDRPIFIIDGGDSENGDPGNDSMPASQWRNMVAALNAHSDTDYFSKHITTGGHAFDNYQFASDSLGLWDWTASIFAGGGGGTPPPPETDVPKGISALYSSGGIVDDSVLANPDVDLISLRQDWADLEPTTGVYDFTYLDSQIKLVAAANKKCIIRILTMGGSRTFGGHTPPHIFDTIGTAINGFPQNRLTVTDGVTTNGSPVVTSTQLILTAADVFQPISGTNIPANSFVGIINDISSPASLGLSSSNTANVPVNATGSGTGITFTFPNRGQAGGGSQQEVPGHIYSYNDIAEGVIVAIPVFWQADFLKKKRAMLVALGDHVTNGVTLAPNEKACIAVIEVNACNAESEDWNVPHLTSDGSGYGGLSQTDEWINVADSASFYPGMSYTSNKLIQAGIWQILPGQGITDIVSNGTTTITSVLAQFTQADVGKQITLLSGGVSIVPSGTKIAQWISLTNVKLSNIATGSHTGCQLVIASRDVGIIDVAMGAFPNQFIGFAIGNNGPRLDADAAALAGDPDVDNYAARTIMASARAKYPGRVVAQVNSFSNTSDEAGNATKGRLKLLNEIHAAGGDVAGQNLWNVVGDTTFRMNGGQPGDETEILEGSATISATYGINFLEVYAKDFSNAEAVNFIHDLLNPVEIGPPPSGQRPGDTQPPVLIYNSVNYREEIQNAIADLLDVSPTSKTRPVNAERAQKWARVASKHARYAWRLINWPDFRIIEERALANSEIWNPHDVFTTGELVYYLGEYDTDGTTVLDAGYYTVIVSPDAGIDPSNIGFFAKYTLVTSDFYVPIQQRCRRKIGRVFGVYPTDPKQWPLNQSIRTLPWTLSERGIEVWGSNFGNTTFIGYQAVPYRWGAVLWDAATIWKAGSLVLWDDDGEVYRASVSVSGIDPSNVNNWTKVPFPAVLANYCVYMTAADDSDDRDQANEWRDIGQEYLYREMDVVKSQEPAMMYSFGGRQSYQLPLGTSGFLWSAVPPFTAPGVSGAPTTISYACVDEWGSQIQ